MIEAVWIAALLAAASIRGRWLLAVLVLAKGVSSWSLSLLSGQTFMIFGLPVLGEFIPTISDVVIGTVAIPLCLSRASFRGDVLAILFVVFPMIHWLYWSAWEVGLWFASEYKSGLGFAYSAMVAMVFPWRGLYVVVVAGAGLLRMALSGPSGVSEGTAERYGRAPAGSGERG